MVMNIFGHYMELIDGHSCKKINIMTSNSSNQERWRQLQRSFEGLTEDMDAVLNIIDEMADFDASAATDLCNKVRRTNPHDTVEYALALEASTWVRILSYLRDSTTTLQLLATKRDFILTLMRQQLAAANPNADPNDIEVELAMQLTERHGQ